MDLPLTELGPYRIHSKLGESELAIVYEAGDSLFGRTVALKVLSDHAAEDQNLVRQFLSSGRESMRLRHENIARVLDVGQAGGRYYIATEFVPGKSLHDDLARGKGAWTAERSLAVASQVAAALDHAHSLGLLHLNLKPSNILLTDDGRALVTDFDCETAPSWTGDPDHPLLYRLRSPAFLSPEQARGMDELSPAADVYSLAALTYTLCAGRAPFAGRNPLRVLRLIAEVVPARADRVIAGLDSRVADGLAWALSKEPGDRPRSAGEFTRSLVDGVDPREPSHPRVNAQPASPMVPQVSESSDVENEPTGQVSTGTSSSSASVAPSEPRRRAGSSVIPTPALALLALASLAAILMLIAAMRTAGTLMARLRDEPGVELGSVEVVAVSLPGDGESAAPDGVMEEETVARTPAAVPTATERPSPTSLPDPSPTPQPEVALEPTTAAVRSVLGIAPRPHQGLIANAGQVRMVALVTPVLPTATSVALPTPPLTATPATTSTARPAPVPSLSPNISLDDYALVGRIAFAQWNVHTDRPDLYIWDAKTRTFGPPIPNYRQPDFGPNGLLVANAEGAGRDNLVQMGWLGENAVVISAHPEDAHPHWSADGEMVVFDSAHMGDRQHRVYLQDDLSRRDDRAPIMYLAWELFGRYPVFLETGQVAYNGCNYWASGSVCGIYSVDVHGGMPAGLTDWPSDIPTDGLGTRVLFMSNRNGSWDVYSVDAAGSDLRRLTQDPGIDGLATASPDGRAVAFLTDREGHWSVYVMRPDGSDLTKMFDLPLSFGRDDYDWFQERLSWGY